MQRRRQKPGSGERGYVLLTLIFFVAVLAISLATILPSIIQEAKRDREEELVHRGAEYTRAIRLYFKKNGRYPAKIEDLESSNNLRFLRKRYKDPMAARDENGETADFKILRFGDPGVRLSQQGVNPAAPALQAAAVGSALNQTAAGTGRQSGLGSSLTPQQDPSDPNANAESANTPAEDANGNPVAKPGENPGDGATGQTSGDKPAAPGSPTYGGGAMVGVVSTSRKNTIREFNKKHHYYEWQFVYDPQTDRGGLPKGPWQPQTFGGQPQPGAGQPGIPA